MDFDNTSLQPVTVADIGDFTHTFEFRSMLVATGHALRSTRDRRRQRRIGNRTSGCIVLASSVATLLGAQLGPPRAKASPRRSRACRPIPGASGSPSSRRSTP
jgi:hypothetical protein